MPRPLIPSETQGQSRHAVWIVEDSALEAEVAKRVLERIYDVVVFDEASTMLETLASAPVAPSAIVLDWQMPTLTDCVWPASIYAVPSMHSHPDTPSRRAKDIHGAWVRTRLRQLRRGSGKIWE